MLKPKCSYQLARHETDVAMANIKSLIYKNLLAGAGYLLAGWLGTLLATQPSHVSPIWPAAGVALAIMLVYGHSLLPGIFLGALAVQFYAFMDVSSFASILDSLGVGVLAGMGACLQAWIGMQLINRWVGRHNPLIDDAKILRFFALIAVSCLISPSVGVATLYFSGVISLSAIPSSWFIWWVGDTIGAAIFTPMLLLLIGQPSHIWQPRRQFVFYPLLFVLLLVVTAFYYSQRQEHQNIEDLFRRQVNLLHSTIKQHLEKHLATNAAIKGLFDSSNSVTQDEFVSFANSIDTSHSSVHEWTPRVRADERETWQKKYNANIRQMTANGTLQPAAMQAEYFPVTFIVPQAGNEAVLGFDVSSNPQVAPIISRAIANGISAATGSIHLAQDDKPHLGTVIYTPVYAKNKPLDSVEARQEQFLGFVACVFRIDTDIEGIFNWLGDKELQLSLEIYDHDQLVYSNYLTDNQQNLRFSKLSKTLIIDFAGRQWQLHYLPTSKFFHQQQSVVIEWLLLGGFLLCSLTAVGLMLLTGRTARVEALVSDRTQNLLRSNQALNQEVTLRRQQENELRIAATTFESHEAIIITDANGSILRVNKAFSDMTGYLARDVIGKNPSLLASGYHEKDFYQQMYTALGQKNQWKGEVWNRRKNGEIFPEILTITGVRDEQNQLTHYVAIFSDISAQKAAEKEIHNLAFYDPLTNLPNRRLMLDRLQQEIAAAKRQMNFGALFFLDLDHFKNLNDSRGHQVGDELLIQVGQRLQSIIRHEDTACRLGGDEFVVMVPGRFLSLQLATNHAVMLAEKILFAISQPYIVQGSEHHFSTSIGVTLYPETIDQPEEIVQQADTAMYRAKESGRNSISFYLPSMQESADRRLTLEKEMRVALQERQFLLHYQPQVNEQHKVISAEALIRWQHPTKGMVSPAEFIPLAEDTQLILPIGAWVLQEACRQIKAWDLQGIKLDHVAVNVSSRQFRQPDFVQQVKQVLLDTDIQAKRLVIELTEGCVIEDIEDTIEKMQALQAMGIRISIDDFGIGYSSLSYLKSLPLSQLKIDQSFVKQIDNVNAAVIVETIIMMAKSLGLNVIAEGVETLEQVNFLTAKGCLNFQGYYFSRPVPADEIKFTL